KPFSFDYIGLSVLCLVMSCWEILLSKGQEWDWLSDTFWRVQTLGILFMFCAFAGLYAASIALPGMLQSLFGYDALRSGLVMSPSGVSSLAAMVTVGILLGRGFDARWLIAIGLLVMAAGNYWM